MAAKGDALDKTIAFLQKREGIDKTLKIIRYTSRLIAAISPPGSDTRKRFEALQSSVGTSRKAYRLGKFLQDVNGLRRIEFQGNSLELLEVLAYTGEGMYYFLDQFLWLMKAGFLNKQQEKQVQKASAWAETIGYAANIALSIHKLQKLQQQEQQLSKKLKAATKDDLQDSSSYGSIASLRSQLQLLQSAKLLRLALICQDLADSITALNDITEGRWQGFNHPVILSCAGLLSAAVSTYKYWGT
eukprot:GHRR01005441.1.p1 GENE.GHRR01005441.1~~GHRR01005441.1.p1  ORF type:complete len:244 (+),score=99.20 GHRR01005441.1:182-913(+)